MWTSLRWIQLYDYQSFRGESDGGNGGMAYSFKIENCHDKHFSPCSHITFCFIEAPAGAHIVIWFIWSCLLNINLLEVGNCSSQSWHGCQKQSFQTSCCFLHLQNKSQIPYTLDSHTEGNDGLLFILLHEIFTLHLHRNMYHTACWCALKLNYIYWGRQNIWWQWSYWARVSSDYNLIDLFLQC